MAERKTISLTSERLIIRLPEHRDIPEIIRFQRRNTAHFAAVFPSRPKGFLTTAFWRERIQAAHADATADVGYRFYMFAADAPREIVGTINLHQVQRGVAQYCVMGYSIDHRHEGRGLMLEGVERIVRFAFDDLNLHRVMANYMPSNERSGRVLRRAGFVVEGYARDYLLINGQWRDHILTSRTNPNWREPRPRRARRRM
ncbi:MAG: GNAT family N-acetyltransferase [Phycisphaerales bacterium]|nr:GNAT family N-acetyltransferase [Phycisphaerales bacterium]